MKLYTGVPTVRTETQWFAADVIDAHDAMTVRWLYRTLRESGVAASTARMVLCCAYNVGVSTEMHRGRP